MNDGPSNKFKGILCILSAAFCFAMMNLCVKLAGDLPTFQKAFFRNVVAIVVALIILLKEKPDLSGVKSNLPLIAGRAFFGTIGIFANFYAIDHLNISDASMLNKLSPFFAILFSYLILREKAKFYQLACVFAALAGTVFILRPSGSELVSVPALIGTCSGIAAGLAYTLLRKATQNGAGKSFIVLFFSVFSCLVSIPFCLMDPHSMTAGQFLALLGAGLAATGGQFSITAAYSFAPASELSVYDYTQVIFAGILGFAFLGEVPDACSLAGYGIIIAAAVVMFIKGQKRKETLENKG